MPKISGKLKEAFPLSWERKIKEKIPVVIRYVLPSIVTLGYFALFLHKSSEEQFLFFSRYSTFFFGIILTSGVCIVALWLVVANTTWYHRLLRNISQIPIIGTISLIVNVVIILDTFPEIVIVVILFPLFVGSGLIWLVTNSSPSRVRMLSDAMKRGALATASIVVSLIIIEIVFITLLIESKVPSTQEQFERLISSNWPHSVSPNKEPCTIRILGLSDSYGVAGGSNNYHYVLEHLFENADFSVDIVNYSVPEYQLFDELVLLKRFGEFYKPDIVLHGVFVGNDLETGNDLDTSERTAIFSLEGSFRGISLSPTYGYQIYWPRKFLSIQWVRRLFRVIHEEEQKRAEIASGVTADVEIGTFSLESFLDIEEERLRIFEIGVEPWQKWSGAASLLDEIVAYTRQIGATYIMVIHPTQIQVEETLRDQVLDYSDVSGANFDFELPQRFLNDYCLTRNIMCFDLMPTIRDYGFEDSLYLSRDTHYNQTGNYIAADAIMDYIIESDVFTRLEDDGCLLVNNTKKERIR